MESCQNDHVSWQMLWYMWLAGGWFIFGKDVYGWVDDEERRGLMGCSGGRKYIDWMYRWHSPDH